MSDQEEPARKIPKFSPFTGFGRRLDGKPSTQPVAPASSPKPKQHQPEAHNGTEDSKSSKPASQQPAGKLVFGSNVNQPQKAAPKVCLLSHIICCLFVVKLGLNLISFILTSLMSGCPREQQSRAASKGGRAKVSSIHREKVFAERLIVMKLFHTCHNR